jgi:hypothetical protein
MIWYLIRNLRILNVRSAYFVSEKKLLLLYLPGLYAFFTVFLLNPKTGVNVSSERILLVTS